MSIHHCDLGLLQWKPSKPGTWPTNLRDMTQIYSNYVMWPTKRELGVFCHNYAKCKCEIYRNMPKSQVFGADHWGTTSTELCFSKHQEFPCQIWWLPLCSAPSRPSEWFNVIFHDFHVHFIRFSIPIYLIYLHFSCCLPSVVLFRIPAARRPQLSRSGPSGPVLPVALSTWILTEPLPFLRQELEPWTQGIPKNPRGFRGGIPGAGDAQNQGTSSCFIGNAWEIIELYVSFDTFFIESLSNSMDHLYYSYISFLKGALSKMNLCIGFREFGPTEGIEHPRATLHHQCMRMPQYAW